MMILDMMLNPDARDRQRLKYFFGFLNPDLPPAKHDGDWWHILKNYFAEWSRSDPQRSGKFVFDLFVLNLVQFLLLLASCSF